MGCGGSTSNDAAEEAGGNFSNAAGSIAGKPSLTGPNIQGVVPGPVKPECKYRTDYDTIRDEIILSLLVCRNCEDTENVVTNWCIQCYAEDADCDHEDTVQLPVQCKACHKGLHKSKKAQKHKTFKWDDHTRDLQHAHAYGYERFPTGLPHLKQLICMNCDALDVARWCGSCHMVLCLQCDKELHSSAKTKSHHGFALKERFVVGEMSEEETLKQLEDLLQTVSGTGAAGPPKSKDELAEIVKSYKTGRPSEFFNINTGTPGDVLSVEVPEFEGKLEMRPYTFNHAVAGLGQVQVTQVACGDDHTGIVTTMGTCYMWGHNHNYQLGRNTGEFKIVNDPIRVEFSDKSLSVKMVACGQVHSAALLTDGSVWTWGAGLMGILGHPEDSDREGPTKVAYFDSMESGEVIYVACGVNNTGVVIRDKSGKNGQVCMWGEGSAGQIGNGEYRPQLTPARIKVELIDGKRHSLPPVMSMEISTKSVAVLDKMGRVYTWGNNQFGELGYHTDDTKTAKPAVLGYLMLSHVKVMQISAGERHFSALDADGHVWSWGSGETHQIGIMDNVDQWTPIRAQGISSETKIVHISCGASMSGAVAENGDTYMWGFSMDSPIPKVVAGLRGNFIQKVAISSYGATVLTGMAEAMYEWDFDDWDIDDNNTQPSEFKALRGKRINFVSCGAEHNAVVTAGGKLLTWGSNQQNQLGVPEDDNITFIPRPTEVVTDYQFECVRAGAEHNVGLTMDGKVVTWGEGGQGRLGHPSNQNQDTPLIVEELKDHKCVFVAVGNENSGAITDRGVLYLWGSNSSGQCGTGDTAPQFAPKKCDFFDGRKVLGVEFGNKNTLVLVAGDEKTDGKNSVYSFGDNGFGQIGNGIDGMDLAMESTPQEVMMVSMMNLDPIQVDCGDNCCFVLARNGQLWGWGCGETNQLCQGDPSDVLQPMQIVFPLDDMTEEEYKLTKIDVEYINCGAVASDGTLFVWGFNFEETPRRVESLDDDGVSIKDIAMGQGTLLCR